LRFGRILPLLGVFAGVTQRASLVQPYPGIRILLVPGGVPSSRLRGDSLLANRGQQQRDRRGGDGGRGKSAGSPDDAESGRGDGRGYVAQHDPEDRPEEPAGPRMLRVWAQGEPQRRAQCDQAQCATGRQQRQAPVAAQKYQLAGDVDGQPKDGRPLLHGVAARSCPPNVNLSAPWLVRLRKQVWSDPGTGLLQTRLLSMSDRAISAALQ
jgi:hypothetical protein